MKLDPDALRQQVEELIKGLREVGCYEDQVAIQATEDGEPKFVVLTMYVGDRAFSQRVQDPSQVGWDAEFREIARRVVEEQFQDERRRLLEGLE
jgi:hypothetical protein